MLEHTDTHTSKHNHILSEQVERMLLVSTLNYLKEDVISELTSYDTICVEMFGNKKTILFVILEILEERSKDDFEQKDRFN